jgi:excisionase family DNA binding protein
VTGGRLLSLGQAAARVGCSTRTIRRRIAAGQLTVFRDRGLLRIPEQALADYLSARTLRPAIRPSQAAPIAATSDAPPPAAARRLWELPDPLDPRAISSNDRDDQTRDTRRAAATRRDRQQGDTR